MAARSFDCRISASTEEQGSRRHGARLPSFANRKAEASGLIGTASTRQTPRQGSRGCAQIAARIGLCIPLVFRDITAGPGSGITRRCPASAQHGDDPPTASRPGRVALAPGRRVVRVCATSRMTSAAPGTSAPLPYRCQHQLTTFYDPTGEKARAVKARCAGVCRGCGAYTQPRNGKGDAYAYCKPWIPARSSNAGVSLDRRRRAAETIRDLRDRETFRLAVMVSEGDRTAALEHTVIRGLGPTVQHASRYCSSPSLPRRSVRRDFSRWRPARTSTVSAAPDRLSQSTQHRQASFEQCRAAPENESESATTRTRIGGADSTATHGMLAPSAAAEPGVRTCVIALTHR